MNVSNRWQNAIGNNNRRNDFDVRSNRWNNWGGQVRNQWNYGHRHDDWFNRDWWRRHPPRPGCWHPWRSVNVNVYRPGVWWVAPTWAATTSWFTWPTTTTVWSQPVAYDYGEGGNVTYQDNRVYVNGTEVASADEFAQSAMDLATVEPPASEEEAEKAEWLPLGTFAVSSGEKDVSPDRSVQLAVSRDGIVAGTLYDARTDKSEDVQGSVDRETQRVAVRVGDSDTVVAETGLYDLTLDEAPLLVHFGTERTEEYLLVRLDPPADADGPDGGGNDAS